MANNIEVQYSTIQKSFGPYPMAHRQHRHDGHCSLIHGHNWLIELVFGLPFNELDDCGFILDFGKFNTLKTIFEDRFDHTLAVSVDDPEAAHFRELESRSLAKITWMENTSCECLCRLVQELVTEWLDAENRANRVNPLVSLVCVVVHEDSKNRASIINSDKNSPISL